MLHVSNSFRMFLETSESKVGQFLHRALKYRRWNYPCANLMVRTNEVNYLTLRDNGQLSYLPKGKPHTLTDDGRWARDGRQDGSPSKIIKKILTKNALKLFKDVDFERFCNQYKSACDAECKSFIIRENIHIPEVYDMKRESGGGTLNDSCMNGDGNYLDLYKYCPKVRILTLVNGCEELCGRALLWDVGNGDELMDRVYVSKDHYYDMFLDYAKENSFIRKVEYKSYKDKTWFTRNGKDTLNKSFIINTSTEFDYYPYIDTFTYGGDGFITNSQTSDCIYEYCCTSGGREEEQVYTCEHSGDRIDADDARLIDRGTYNGSYVHRDYSVYCQTDGYWYYSEDNDLVEINDRWYSMDDDNVVEIDDTWYHTNDDDVSFSDFHGEYVVKDDCVYSEHHESYIKEDEAYEVAGEYFHESVVNKVA